MLQTTDMSYLKTMSVTQFVFRIKEKMPKSLCFVAKHYYAFYFSQMVFLKVIVTRDNFFLCRLYQIMDKISLVYAYKAHGQQFNLLDLCNEFFYAKKLKLSFFSYKKMQVNLRVLVIVVIVIIIPAEKFDWILPYAVIYSNLL